jgi:hypothetical protein
MVAHPNRISFAFILLVLATAGWLHMGALLVSVFFSYFVISKLDFMKPLGRWLAVVIFLVLLAGLANKVCYDFIRGQWPSRRVQTDVPVAQPFYAIHSGRLFVARMKTNLYRVPDRETPHSADQISRLGFWNWKEVALNESKTRKKAKFGQKTVQLNKRK